jgi:hypothetical protein
MRWNPPVKAIDDIFADSVEDERAASGFSVAVPDTLSFRWEDLILSIGRTQMLSMAHSKLSHAARDSLVRDVSVAIMTHMGIFVDAASSRFAFTRLLDELADEERTSLASKVGAAVTDLLMEKSGYQFRANARELNFSKPAGSKIPDFVYDDGNGDNTKPSNVVVVEAKGSLSKYNATKGRLTSRAAKAYEDQVRNFVGETAHDIAISGGCVVAFGCIPGQALSRVVVRASGDVTTLPLTEGVPSGAGAGRLRAGVARSLSAAASQPMPMPQPQIKQEQQKLFLRMPSPHWGGRGTRGGGGDGDGEPRPHGRITYANYESVFQLCGATDAAQALRRSLAGIADDEDVQRTQVFYVSASDNRFLFRRAPFAPCWSPGYFAIYLPAAEAILKSLANSRLAPPKFVSIPEIPPDLSGGEGGIVVQADGLAWVNRWTEPLTIKEWDLSAGRW